jgi:hypothetical protein|tara:strand:+ start:756 stop:1115 length:360 start_codon:yes stop_codon:yes gene_type:complete
MLKTLLGILVLLLTTRALIYPGGPLGFIMLYRVTQYMKNSIHEADRNTHVDAFGALCVVVPNKEFFIRQNKTIHHQLLNHLAKRFAPRVGYINGVARVDGVATLFRFSAPVCEPWNLGR